MRTKPSRGRRMTSSWRTCRRIRPLLTCMGRLTVRTSMREPIMKLMRRLLWGLPVVAALGVAGAVLTPRSESAPDEVVRGRVDGVGELKPAVSLPISKVILFNSGVGHFTRSGEVEGDARVDLTFPEQD